MGMQEHHLRPFNGTLEFTKRIRGEDWEAIGNTSQTAKSGVMVMCKAGKFHMANTYSTCARTLVVVLRGKEGQMWTIISAQFHHYLAPSCFGPFCSRVHQPGTLT